MHAGLLESGAVVEDGSVGVRCGSGQGKVAGGVGGSAFCLLLGHLGVAHLSVHSLTASMNRTSRGMKAQMGQGLRYDAMVGHKLLSVVLGVCLCGVCVWYGQGCLQGLDGGDAVLLIGACDGLEGLGCDAGQGVHVMVGVKVLCGATVSCGLGTCDGLGASGLCDLDACGYETGQVVGVAGVAGAVVAGSAIIGAAVGGMAGDWADVAGDAAADSGPCVLCALVGAVLVAAACALVFRCHGALGTTARLGLGVDADGHSLGHVGAAWAQVAGWGSEVCLWVHGAGIQVMRQVGAWVAGVASHALQASRVASSAVWARMSTLATSVGSLQSSLSGLGGSAASAFRALGVSGASVWSSAQSSAQAFAASMASSVILPIWSIGVLLVAFLVMQLVCKARSLFWHPAPSLGASVCLACVVGMVFLGVHYGDLGVLGSE